MGDEACLTQGQKLRHTEKRSSADAGGLRPCTWDILQVQVMGALWREGQGVTRCSASRRRYHANRQSTMTLNLALMAVMRPLRGLDSASRQHPTRIVVVAHCAPPSPLPLWLCRAAS